MKHCGGHVVPLAASKGEFLNGSEYVAKKIERTIAGMAAANILKIV